MTAIIKNKFRLKNAKNFIESFEIPENSKQIISLINGTQNPLTPITEAQKELLQKTLKTVPDRNHYLFIGKPFGWDTTENPTNTNSNTELNPPLPLDTQNGECIKNRTDGKKDRTDGDISVWDEMLSLKKISRPDVSLVIPRSDWRPNTVYAQFDDADVDLYRQPTTTRIDREVHLGRRAGNFYVLNNMMELFICIDNNNESVSTITPTRLEMNGSNSDRNGRFRSPDGYVWQYVTTISAGEAVKFLTDSWIPVRTLPDDSNLNIPQLDVQANAIPGELLRVEVTPAKTNLDIFYSYVGGKVVKSSEDTLTIVLEAALPVPRLGADNIDAYKGYQIIVKKPEVDTGEVLAKYTIKNYSVSPYPSLVLESNATELLSDGTKYPCEILPLINVETNGTSEINVKPILNPAGKITSVKILNPGSGATTVKMSVNLPHNFDVENLPTLRPILSPVHGLCADPESDLGAFFVMMSTQLKYDEGLGDFPIANDYRQIGIIRDVKKVVRNQTTNRDEVVLATEQTLNATKVVNVKFATEEKLGSGGLAFQSDDVVDITLNGSNRVVGRAKVVQFLRNPDITNDLGQTIFSGKLFLIQTRDTGYYPIQFGQTYSVTSRSVEALAHNPDASTPAVIAEELLKFNGDILYLENRRPVLRAIDQIEDIKTIVEF